jgi:CBS domain-containing protein
MKITDIINTDVVTLPADSSIAEAAALLREHHIGDVVVIDPVTRAAPVPVGILTDRDIVLSVLAGGLDDSTVTVGDIMSGDLMTLARDAELLAALARMRERGVRRAPVVDDDGVLTGIVSLDDILCHFGDALGEVAELIRQARGIERYRRPT